MTHTYGGPRVPWIFRGQWALPAPECPGSVPASRTCTPGPFVLSPLPVPPSPSHVRETLRSLKPRNSFKEGAPGVPWGGPYGRVGAQVGRVHQPSPVSGFLGRYMYRRGRERFHSVRPRWQHVKQRAPTQSPAPRPWGPVTPRLSSGPFCSLRAPEKTPSDIRPHQGPLRSAAQHPVPTSQHP